MESKHGIKNSLEKRIQVLESRVQNLEAEVEKLKNPPAQSALTPLDAQTARRVRRRFARA